MADNTTIKWSIGIALYYLLFFVVMFAYISSMTDIDAQIEAIHDPSAINIENAAISGVAMPQLEAGGVCEPYPVESSLNGALFYTGGIRSLQCDEVIPYQYCENVQGCQVQDVTNVEFLKELAWSYAKTKLNINTSGSIVNGTICVGIINVSYYWDNPDELSLVEMNKKLYEAEKVKYDELTCTALGLRWVTNDEYISEHQTNKALQTLKLMTGFKADVGLSSYSLGFLWTFIFFWMPILIIGLMVVIYARG